MRSVTTARLTSGGESLVNPLGPLGTDAHPLIDAPTQTATNPPPSLFTGSNHADFNPSVDKAFFIVNCFANNSKAPFLLLHGCNIACVAIWRRFYSVGGPSGAIFLIGNIWSSCS